MLAAESISSEKDLIPYWNEVCQENNSLLWLPTKTALHGSDTICSREYLSGTEGESWYSMKSHLAPKENSHKICLQSFMSFRADYVESESTKKQLSKKVKARQVRIYPTASQKSVFDLWFEAGRWSFNKAKEICDVRGRMGEKVPGKYELRDNVLSIMPERFGDVPFLVKAGGALDYYRARSNAIQKFKETGRIQEVSFRSRKNPSQSCRIKPESVTHRGVYASVAGGQVLSEYYKPVSECILKRKNGRYILCVMVEDVWACENQASGSVVAVDPGVRTFLTWYAGDSCGKIGEQDFNRIYRLCLNLDNIISKRALSRNHRERRALKKAAERLRNRISDLITELHRKAAIFFVSNFDVILLPTFGTKDMTERNKRRINSKSARNMLTFSHFKFKQYIKHKALQKGKVVIDANEAYTSETVSWTGEVKKIGCAKTISSGRGTDKVVVDRDYNGARGIMLRALRASSMKVVE